MYSYHSNMHLFRARIFWYGPISRTQRFRYRSIKQNKAFRYRPITTDILKKMSLLYIILYHSKMDLFRPKTFLYQPIRQTQRFRYRSINQNKAFCYRLISNKKRYRTMSSNLWESAVPCIGNPWFQHWEPWVPTFGNRQLLALVTTGSKVGNHEFQPLGTGNSLQW